MMNVLVPKASYGKGDKDARRQDFAQFLSISKIAGHDYQLMDFVEDMVPRGGLELLFGSVKIHEVNITPVDGQKKTTVEHLLIWIRDNLLKERPEMFLKDKSVRPGILVLINDCDWELCGTVQAELEDNDAVVFISTLHGG